MSGQKAKRWSSAAVLFAAVAGSLSASLPATAGSPWASLPTSNSTSFHVAADADLVDLGDAFDPGFEVAADPTALERAAETGDQSIDDLAAELQADDRLWVDPTGVVLAVEPVTPSGLDAQSPPPPTDVSGAIGPRIRSAPLAGPSAGALAALTSDQTFALHSRVGASKTAYLDFDGQTVSGTAWNDTLAGGADIVIPAWDLDGSPGTFGPLERSVILEIWRRVSEDYAPFDIDVTTAPPSVSDLQRSSADDQRFGTTVAVSPPSALERACDCAGVSYVGTVDRVGDNLRYQPNVVFSARLGAASVKHLSEAISHEIGHGFGLGHVLTSPSGTYYGGEGAWAPIMGISYDRPITQWLGDDAVAGKVYREVDTMARHGLAVIADDFGDSPAFAANLGAGPSLGVNGLISTRADVDVFAFTTSGGPVSLSADVEQPGANLDIRLELLAANGTLIASDNPESNAITSQLASGLDARLATTLPAGTYFIRIAGVGSGTLGAGGYSDQGSLGRYSVLGTIPTTTNRAPIPVPSVNAAAWGEGATVRFDASKSTDVDGRVTQFWWDFGDGSVSALATVDKTFSTMGSFVVVLTVVDDNGAVASAAVLMTIGPDGGVITSLDIAGETGSAHAASREVADPAPAPAAAALPFGALPEDSGVATASLKLPETA